MFSLKLSDANDPQGLMRRKEPNKQTNKQTQVRNNCFHVDNMKKLFQDIHIDSIMTCLRQINLFNKI